MKHRHVAQLSGRFPWNKDLVVAARRFTREGTDENKEALSRAQSESAAEAIAAQASLGFEYVSDGGAWAADIFSPYVDGVEGVSSEGNIDKYPGTRNSYYHTPIVTGKIRPQAPLHERLTLPEFPTGAKKMAILPSPAAFALSSEDTHYGNLERVASDFSEVLRKDVQVLSKAGYEYVQLNEGFLPNPRFSGRGSGLANSLKTDLKTVFDGFRGRAGLYFHSGDASRLVPEFMNLGLTDLGFDFNTPLDSVADFRFEENLVLGFQNATRKLPDDLLDREPEILAARFRGASAKLKVAGGKTVAFAPSQDLDGLQTHDQALRRIGSLASAVKLVEAAF